MPRLLKFTMGLIFLSLAALYLGIAMLGEAYNLDYATSVLFGISGLVWIYNGIKYRDT